MPELPEVETVRRGLEPVMVGNSFGQVELFRRDLRFPLPDDFERRLRGQTVTSLDRRAKYLLAHLSGGEMLLMHLGMSGRFTITARSDEAPTTDHPGRFHREIAAPSLEAHTHVRFRFDDGAVIDYADPRRFGIMDIVPAGGRDDHRLLGHLGIEPLGNELSGPFLNAALRGKRTPLKAALLDQRIIVGIGNIYACEALFRAGLSPRRQARSITARRGTTDRAERLASAIRDVLGDAIAAGGSSLRDYANADGELGYFQHAFEAYDREGEPCARAGCAGTVRRIVQSGRSSFFCPACQR